jgi:hypothetical protein
VNEIEIMQDPSFYLDWATVNFRNDEQQGVATLAAGTATVASRNSNLRGVTVSRNTPAGAVGDLSAPTATRAADQFVINSASATDTSTVDWHIPPWTGSGTIVIGPMENKGGPPV